MKERSDACFLTCITLYYILYLSLKNQEKTKTKIKENKKKYKENIRKEESIIHNYDTEC